MSASDSFSDRNSWLEYFGLDPRKNPFQEVIAEKEKDLLDRYFTRFPFFEDMCLPQTTFLFLKRGTGKSANRIMLQKHIQDYSSEPTLVVPCISYNKLVGKTEVTLRDYVDVIMKTAVHTLYEFLPKTNLNDRIGLMKSFIPFLRQYPKHFSKSKIAVEKRDLAGGFFVDIFEKFGLSHTEKVLEELMIGDSVDFSEIDEIEIVEQFGEIVKACGFKHVFIFIDGIDDDIGNDFQKAANMLSSLLSATTLLELSPFAFKFFLPLETYYYILQENKVRFDRLKVLSYKPEELWTKEQLQCLLENRMEAFAIDHNLDSAPVYGESKSLSWLFEDELRNTVECEIIALADASPRRLIYLVREIIAQHTMLPPIKPYISKQTYENAKEIFQGKKTSN